MRKVPILLAAAATLALAGGVPPATASRGYHGCPQLRTRTGNVTKVRTQYSCAYTRRKLRSLLGKGVDRIPEARRRSGRWGCRLAGQTWSCQKYSRRGRGDRRIRFRLEVDIQSGGGGSGGGGPVNPLKRCADLWNGDIANRGFFGYHIYADHGVRRLWVFELPTSKRCAVIGAVPAGDYEFGNDGEVSNVTTGWVYMRDVPELGDPVAVQTQAATSANATLNSDYSITLDPS